MERGGAEGRSVPLAAANRGSPLGLCPRGRISGGTDKETAACASGRVHLLCPCPGLSWLGHRGEGQRPRRWMNPSEYVLQRRPGARGARDVPPGLQIGWLRLRTCWCLCLGRGWLSAAPAAPGRGLSLCSGSAHAVDLGTAGVSPGYVSVSACVRGRERAGVGCLSLCSFPTDAAFPSGPLPAEARLPRAERVCARCSERGNVESAGALALRHCPGRGGCTGGGPAARTCVPPPPPPVLPQFQQALRVSEHSCHLSPRHGSPEEAPAHSSICHFGGIPCPFRSRVRGAAAACSSFLGC